MNPIQTSPPSFVTDLGAELSEAQGTLLLETAVLVTDDANKDVPRNALDSKT